MSNGANGVRVGNVRPMTSGQAPEEDKEETNFERTMRLLFQSGAQLPVPGTTGGGMTAGMPVTTPRGGLSPYAPDEIITRPFGSETWSGQRDYPTAAARVADEARIQQMLAAQQPAEPDITRGDVLNQIMAELGLLGGGGGGGGAVRPDYSAYRAALTDQAQQLNAQIQAMYNQLAAQAGENVSRIQDIYGGASAGIGDVYGSATENIAQAYESAQQQAADQMARLGIEAAAPQILPTQALSQAEAVAGLEAGRAGGLSAAERYGASGAQFGSEMAQVAQQQGTEMNAAILASLQNRLAESLAAEQAGVSGGGGGGRGMSVSDMLRLQEYADEVYRRDVLGELPLEEREFAARLAGQRQESYADIFNTAISLVETGLYDNLDDALTAATLGYSGQ